MNPYDELEDDDDGDFEMPARPRKDIPAPDMGLLRLAARAIGAELEEVDGEEWVNLHFEDGSILYAWNPLYYSGDAFELSVKLNTHILRFENMVTAWPGLAEIGVDEWDNGDASAATRRAVTRAAAEIGKIARQ